jgi:hypothetical protein
MTDTIKEKGRRVTFEWSEEEDAALDAIAQRDPFLALGSSRRAIIRYVILRFAQQGDIDHAPATQGDMKEVMTTLRGLAIILRSEKSAPANTPGKRGPKPKDNATALANEEKIEAGEEICSALGGKVSGLTCVYKKHEVMATGRPVSFDVSEPLAVLTEAHLIQQFDPSRDEYDRAVAAWKDSE